MGIIIIVVGGVVVVVAVIAIVVVVVGIWTTNEDAAALGSSFSIFGLFFDPFGLPRFFPTGAALGTDVGGVAVAAADAITAAAGAANGQI